MFQLGDHGRHKKARTWNLNNNKEIQEAILSVRKPANMTASQWHLIDRMSLW